MATPSSDDVLVIGRVVRPHGVRGELVVEIRTDSPEERFAPGTALGVRPRTGPTTRMILSAARPHTGRLLVFLDGVVGRDAAQRLRGALLTVDRADLPAIDDPEQFYDHQLEGLRAVHDNGEPIGVVTEVMHGLGGEVLVIRRADDTEVLVPFVTAIVPTVDLAGGTLTITPPEGLLVP